MFMSPTMSFLSTSMFFIIYLYFSLWFFVKNKFLFMLHITTFPVPEAYCVHLSTQLSWHLWVATCHRAPSVVEVVGM